MKKRIIPLILLSVFTISSLVGCNKKNDSTTNLPTSSHTTPNTTIVSSTVSPNTTLPSINTTETPITSITTIHVESVSLSADKISLSIGEIANLTISIFPESATDKSYTLSCNNNDIISIENNVITALKEGDSTITVTTNDGEKTDSIDISVISQYNKVSITIDTLPESVTDFSIEGSISKSKITDSGTYNNFYVGDVLTGYINGTANKYEVYIYVGELESEISELLFSSSGFEIASDYGSNLMISVVEANFKPVSVNVVNSDNLDVEFTVNYTNKYETLPNNIQIGDWITISVASSDIPSGYECIITYEYENSTSQKYEHGIDVTGDLTITISLKKIESILVRIIFNVTKYTDDDNPNTGIGNYCRDSNYNYYTTGDNYVKYREKLFLVTYITDIKIKIEVNGKTIFDGRPQYKYSFEVTGETIISLYDL